MEPDAKLRMQVYQEGQRAYRSGEACPYTDWRAGTWRKGLASAMRHTAEVAEDTKRLEKAQASADSVPAQTGSISADEVANQLRSCAIAVSDWLAGGCDANVIPKPQIAALVAWVKESAPHSIHIYKEW